MKVITIVGTRPELIRLCLIIQKLDKVVEHVLVHTGQNYDYELNGIFFRDLGIRKPDYFLNAAGKTLGQTIGNILVKSEAVFKKVKPDALFILGDTNSSLSAIIAQRMHIPIFHMEAGNRSFDLNVPEETNRKILDHISDINIVYTEHARRNLINEGLPARRTYLSGSPMHEVLNSYKARISASDVLSKLKLTPRKYFVVSMHREENVDNKDNLVKLIWLLNLLVRTYKLPAIVSTHPRTRKRLMMIKGITVDKRVFIFKPFGYFDYIKLQYNALCVLSDSGTISEEAAMLKFPAVTMRNAMERPEAMDSGHMTLTGLEPDAVLRAVAYSIQSKDTICKDIPAEYQVENVTERVVKLILGLTGLVRKWQGLQINDLR